VSEAALRRGELIVDSFAGGGGASLGISWALGRGPHIAINHDKEAIALHRANHHDSQHFSEDVWAVDPATATKGRPVGLMWLSPDCKHFSKAKGSAPVSPRVRGLAWVAVRWAAAVKPRVIVLENVEEFQTWGPLHRTHSGRCKGVRPRRAPAIRYRANGCLKTCVYQTPIKARMRQTFNAFVNRLERLGYQVEHRELRACDYGTPTIRKRLFLIARCDGQPIVWPAPTHGKGRAKPWRTAAECIDFDRECPSIFTRRRELAEKTKQRIARGVQRFVIDNPRPFIVPMTHANRPTGVDEPLQTITTQGNKFNLVAPVLAGVGGRAGQSPERSVGRPYATVTAKGDTAVVAPMLVPRYGERSGQRPRSRSVGLPLPTIVTKDNGAQLVAAFMAQHNTGMVGHPIEKPLSTIVGKGCTQNLAAVSITTYYGPKAGERGRGQRLTDPLATQTAENRHALVAAHLTKFKGTSRSGQAADEPIHTIQAQGLHYAEVRAFLVTYYGTPQQTGDLRKPAPTVTSRDRIGLVTVEGQDYLIADIGMRMLWPRELYRAQGFPDTYRIDIEYNGKPLSKAAQVRMCGNSVCPDLAEAIVRANFSAAAAKRHRKAA
jgi:DNA (cytosine-5)-methyltransferase 1